MLFANNIIGASETKTVVHNTGPNTKKNIIEMQYLHRNNKPKQQILRNNKVLTKYKPREFQLKPKHKAEDTKFNGRKPNQLKQDKQIKARTLPSYHSY